MSEPVLFLRLEGVLQAWGDNARWTIRSTRNAPTKSGVIGLIATASGWGLNPEGDAKSAELASQLRMAVRIDRPGKVIRDYHTVSGGVLSAEGKVKINAGTKLPETVVSERFYLADACFLVALSGERTVLEQIAIALKKPVWTPFLGRKCCPPSAPLIPALPGRAVIEEYASLEEAIRLYPILARPEDSISQRLHVEIEMTGQGSPQRTNPVTLRRDQPVSFSRRLFETRSVMEMECNAPGGG